MDEVGPKFRAWIFVRVRTPREDRSRNWGDVSTSQGTPTTAGNHQEQGGRRESLSELLNLATILLLAFQPPEPQGVY